VFIAVSCIFHGDRWQICCKEDERGGDGAAVPLMCAHSVIHISEIKKRWMTTTASDLKRFSAIELLRSHSGYSAQEPSDTSSGITGSYYFVVGLFLIVE
jgi:hypothetical protein